MESGGDLRKMRTRREFGQADPLEPSCHYGVGKLGSGEVEGPALAISSDGGRGMAPHPDPQATPLSRSPLGEPGTLEEAAEPIKCVFS